MDRPHRPEGKLRIEVADDREDTCGQEEKDSEELYPENEESMVHYNDFDEIYSRIKNAENSAELLNNFTLKLKDSYSFDYKGDKCYMKTPKGKEFVKGWGKLLFFFTNPVTGEDVSQYVYQQKLLPNFSLRQIRDSIFYLVMQGFFMTKNLIIV